MHISYFCVVHRNINKGKTINVIKHYIFRNIPVAALSPFELSTLVCCETCWIWKMFVFTGAVAVNTLTRAINLTFKLILHNADLSYELFWLKILLSSKQRVTRSCAAVSREESQMRVKRWARRVGGKFRFKNHRDGSLIKPKQYAAYLLQRSIIHWSTTSL